MQRGFIVAFPTMPDVNPGGYEEKIALFLPSGWIRQTARGADGMSGICYAKSQSRQV